MSILLYYGAFAMAIATNFIVSAAICAAAVGNVNRRLASSDPARGAARFVDYPAEARKDVFRPNTNFWARGIDFSCASPWNAHGGTTRAGTLISKRHIIFAKHYPLAIGTRLLFVGDDGYACPVRLKASTSIPCTDIAVGLLDVEVTPGIHPAKILPPDAGRYIGTGAGLPVGTFTQQEKMYLAALAPLPADRRHATRCHAPKDPRWLPYHGRLIGGDSGNPAFLLLGDEAVLLYCLTGGGSGSGPGLHAYARDIQSAMDALCPGYTLQTFDFTARATAPGLTERGSGP